MAKYSMECKLKIVREYLAGKGSYEALSKQHKIASGHIKTWVKVYEAFGAKGLERSRAQQTYTFEFKRSAVECYLSTEASYQEAAICLGLNNPSLLVRWTKQYRMGGVDALRPKSKGRSPAMPKQRKERILDTPQDETTQQLHALQEENLRLRIENAYLKELRRLRLQEAMQSKKQGSSAASEENFS
ncbi:helix-turn-helix domain-containing protein [Selenomonas artemidis]|jgi:transposase IS3/IS911 family protein|uniref:Transposase n=1 Tax=Selenomonas artemidis F0399 TaxID=749551 RepID=E7N312_9FIRM|nr:helix-turn-helix domain-containing protein [Selenomonas artemidis]EFW29573.1 transposase [Selenomonas artemidis F0399]